MPIDGLFILEYIKNKLNCGHIYISGKNCIILLMIKILYYNFITYSESESDSVVLIIINFILFEKVVIKDKKTFIKRR